MASLPEEPAVVGGGGEEEENAVGNPQTSDGKDVHDEDDGEEEVRGEAGDEPSRLYRGSASEISDDVKEGHLQTCPRLRQCLAEQ